MPRRPAPLAANGFGQRLDLAQLAPLGHAAIRQVAPRVVRRAVGRPRLAWRVAERHGARAAARTGETESAPPVGFAIPVQALTRSRLFVRHVRRLLSKPHAQYIIVIAMSITQLR